MKAKYTHRHMGRGFGAVSEVEREDGQILWLVEPGHGEKQSSVRPAFGPGNLGENWWDFTFQGGGDCSRPGAIPEKYNTILDTLPWDTYQAVYKAGEFGWYFHVADGLQWKLKDTMAYEVPLVDVSAKLVSLVIAALAVFHKEHGSMRQLKKAVRALD